MSSGLDVEILVQINVVIAGADAQIRDLKMLHAIINTVDAEVGGMELYPTPFAKAAVLAKCIAQTQPFANHNDLTAWIAATAYLGLHQIDLRRMPPDEPMSFIRRLAEGEIDHPEAVDWLVERRLGSDE